MPRSSIGMVKCLVASGYPADSRSRGKNDCKVFNNDWYRTVMEQDYIEINSSQRWSLRKNAHVVWSHMDLSAWAQSREHTKFGSCIQQGVSPWRPGKQQVFFLKLDGGLLHVAMAGLRRRQGKSIATGIRLLYCEMERPGNLPYYPRKQHYGRCRHNGNIPAWMSPS